MLDYRSTTDQIREARPQLAVLGIGAIEQHSHHLPVATDWITIREVSRRAAEALDALLLPALPFSMSECHGPMDGTVWLKPATLAAVLRDVAQALDEQGIHHLLLLNGHGGNFVIEPTIQALNQTLPGFQVVMPAIVGGLAPGREQIFEAAVGIHAGEAETSTELYLNGENVGEARVDYVPPVGREFLDYVFMNLISPDGVWGLSSYGSAAKGEKAIAAQVEAVVAFAREAFGEVAVVQEKEEEG